MVDRMRTTLDLPEGLVEAARDTVGFKSKTDTVVYALKEVVRRGRIDELKALFGKVHIALDLDVVRERPRKRARARR
jgi:hypothetical protein